MKRKASALFLALCMMFSGMATAVAEAETTVDLGDEDVTIKVGETVKLQATVTPAVQPEEIVWDSDHKEIATVDAQGNVRGVAGGEAYISASVNGAQASVLVIVTVPTSYTADTFDELDQAAILDNMNKILGPMETDQIKLAAKRLANHQSMMLSKDILNKTMALAFSLDAKLLDDQGNTAYVWTFNVDLNGSTQVTSDVDLAVDIRKAADSRVAALFPAGKSLMFDVKHNGALPEGTELTIDHQNVFDNEQAYLYKVSGDGKVTKVSQTPETMNRDMMASLRVNQGGTYVLSTDQYADCAHEFVGQDLIDNKQAVLDSLRHSSQKMVTLAFNAADETAAIPADVLETALAHGKQLAVVLDNGDGEAYVWLFNAYGETKTVTATDVKLFIERQDVSQDAAMQALVGGQGKTMRIEFAHEGALPEGTALALPVGSLFAEEETLYLYQLKNGALLGTEEAGGPTKSYVKNGLVVYEVSHCSSYVLTNVAPKQAAPETTTPQGQPENTVQPGAEAISPQTGDGSGAMLWTMLAGTALAGLALTAGKRRATK